MYDVISMKSIAKTLNDLTYTDYYYRLVLIARSVYKWNNLPNGISEKWLERYLFNEGECIFYNDPVKGFMIAKCTESGALNYYDEPTLLTPYGTGYMGKPLQNGDECVMIQNNDLRLPTSPTLQLYAFRLAEATRTSDVNINAQKTPTIVLCNDRQKTSLKRAINQVQENEVVIWGDKNLDIEGVKALKIDAPIVFDKIRLEKHAIWNECMTFLGLNNANQDKRERLVANEVEANNEQVEACGNVFLKARQEACEKINKLFDLDISVEMRVQPTPTLEETEGGFLDADE